nr:MAG TPA: Helix-turn-helix XRE-family like protein [Caudoviricetes sp.]
MDFSFLPSLSRPFLFFYSITRVILFLFSFFTHSSGCVDGSHHVTFLILIHDRKNLCQSIEDFLLFLKHYDCLLSFVPYAYTITRQQNIVNTFLFFLRTFGIYNSVCVCYTSFKKRGDKMNERLKQLRLTLEMSQEEFGKLLGITKSGVSDIESGRRKVTEQHIIMLKSQKSQINEEWLRTGNGEMLISQTEDEQISLFIGDLLKDEEESFKRRLISGLAALDQNGWDVLEKFLDSIQKKRD